MRRLGAGEGNYRIHDIEWRHDIQIHEETKWYRSFVKNLTDYNRAALEEVIRL